MIKAKLEKLLEQSEQSEPTEKQQKILDTAIRLFAEKGYTNTSTAEIAKEAGVSVGTLFNYYKTKEKLLLAIIFPPFKTFFPRLSEKVSITKDTTFEDFLETIVRNRAKLFEENTEIFRVIVKESFYHDELRTELLTYFNQYGLELLSTTIEYFKAKGELRDLPTERIVKIIFTNLGGFFITSMLFSSTNQVNDDTIKELVSFMMYGLKK